MPTSNPQNSPQTALQQPEPVQLHTLHTTQPPVSQAMSTSLISSLDALIPISQGCIFCDDDKKTDGVKRQTRKSRTQKPTPTSACAAAAAIYARAGSVSVCRARCLVIAVFFEAVSVWWLRC
jgi:hypothetical protein